MDTVADEVVELLIGSWVTPTQQYTKHGLKDRSWRLIGRVARVHELSSSPQYRRPRRRYIVEFRLRNDDRYENSYEGHQIEVVAHLPEAFLLRWMMTEMKG